MAMSTGVDAKVGKSCGVQAEAPWTDMAKLPTHRRKADRQFSESPASLEGGRGLAG